MPETREEQRRLAETIRTACVKAARDGYQNAAISGLCSEGAQEAALSAIQMMDVEQILMNWNKSA
jgi:hypothetical protein